MLTVSHYFQITKNMYATEKEEETLRMLKELVQSGVSYYEIAKELNISRVQVARWAEGTNKPKGTNVDKLYNYLQWKKTGVKMPSDKELADIISRDLVSKLSMEEFEYIPLVPIRARAGYLVGYGDQEFINELPIMPVRIDRTFKGTYMCFEVEGDSMDDGSSDSIKSGDVILGREVKKELWRSKLHIKDWFFIIVHKEGIMIKQIVKHDIEKGTITCHSLNPIYGEDFILRLDDTYELYNAVQIVARQIRM